MPTVDIEVSAGGNDAQWIPAVSGFDNTQSEPTIGWSGGTDDHNGIFLFVSTIPQGATIDVAYIELVGAGAGDAMDLDILAADADNPTMPTDDTEAGAYTLTTASVNWAATIFLWGSTYSSPSIVSVIQEVVDRAGFAGNILIYIMARNTSAFSRAFHYENGAGTRPSLHVEYTEGAAAADAFMAWSGKARVQRLNPLVRM